MSNGANGGQASFTNGQVIMSDSLPVGADYVYGSKTDGTPAPTGEITCGVTTGVLSCTAGTGGAVLPAGASFSVTVTGTVTQTSTGTLTNRAVVDPDRSVTESDENNNDFTDNVPVGLKLPDLSVEKSNDAGTGPFYLGTSFTWTITVSNSGSMASFADGEVIVTDTLPSGPDYTNLTGPSPAVTNLNSAWWGMY